MNTTTTSDPNGAGAPPAAERPASRFLSRDECAALVKRVTGFAAGGGDTTVFLTSTWMGNIRWARNEITTSGDVRDNDVRVQRTILGASGAGSTNRVDDGALLVAVRRAERFVPLSVADPEYMLSAGPFIEPYPEPKIWSEATYQQDAAARADLVRALAEPARKAGMLSAGYVQVSAYGRASMAGDRVWYYPYTLAQCSVTVRDPKGTGSGWAGIDHNDWSKIDARALAETALDKCLRSRNPVRLEPGRYTTIMEPQAVADLTWQLFSRKFLDRLRAEQGGQGMGQSSGLPEIPFGKGNGSSRLGERVIDERLTVSIDPTDPECAFPPFLGWQVFHPVTWIKDGVLQNLAYFRQYAVQKLGQNTGGLATVGAFRMSGRGEPTSVDEMIATTKRGLIVTRFWGVTYPPLEDRSLLLAGYTRDGVWLVENGKVTKPVKNFRFTDSPVFALNNVEQIGIPKRVFHHPNDGTPDGYAPVIVPALKVRDFSFTSLSDAV